MGKKKSIRSKLSNPSKPPKQSNYIQTPFHRWILFLVLAPWLHLVVGAIVIILAETKPEPLSLIQGIAISLYAVSLLASTVFAFGSSCPPVINPKVKSFAKGTLIFVALIAIILVVLWQTENIQSTTIFIMTQVVLVIIALPVSWKARA